MNMNQIQTFVTRTGNFWTIRYNLDTKNVRTFGGRQLHAGIHTGLQTIGRVRQLDLHPKLVAAWTQRLTG